MTLGNGPSKGRAEEAGRLPGIGSKQGIFGFFIVSNEWFTREVSQCSNSDSVLRDGGEPMPAAVPLELREPKDVCKISLVFDVIGCNDSVAEFLIDDFALVVK